MSISWFSCRLLTLMPSTIKWLMPWVAMTQVSVVLGQPYDPPPQVLRVMTWNVEWMFDHYQGDNRSDLAKEQSAPSRAYWLNKLQGVAKVIAEAQPDILALQEIEGDQTLRDLRQELREQHDISYWYAFIQGRDTFTEQDVGLLMRSGLVSYRRQEQSRAMFESNQFYNLSKHMVAQFRWRDISRPLTIMNLHLRARPEVEAVRIRQARLARLWLETTLQQGHDVILLGDLNTEHPIGDLTGDVAALIGPENGTRLVDLFTRANEPPQPTHLILERHYDRIFVSPSLLEDEPGQDWVFTNIEVIDGGVIRGMRDGEPHWEECLTMDLEELDLSDHLPVIATFDLK